MKYATEEGYGLDKRYIEKRIYQRVEAGDLWHADQARRNNQSGIQIRLLYKDRNLKAPSIKEAMVLSKRFSHFGT